MRPRRTLLLIACLSAMASAAAAQTAADAQAALERGDPDTAVATLQGLVERAPEDASLWRRLAGAQAAAGDYAAAQAAIDRAHAIAPADLDIRAARTRILLWSGARAEARVELAAIVSADPAFPEIGQLQRSLEETSSIPGVRRSLFGTLGSSRVHTRGGSQTWSTASVAGYTGIGDRVTLSGEATRETRRQVDTHLAATLEGEVRGARVHLGATATPNADFREQWSVKAGGERDVGAGVTLLADLRHAHYATASITVLQPAIRYRFADGRATVTARWINLFAPGERYRAGASFMADYDLGKGRGLYAGVAGYPDTEAGVTRQVRSFFVGGVAPLSERVSLRAGVEYERRARSYTRRGATLGVAWRLGG